MERITEERLKKAGWKRERAISIVKIEESYLKLGMQMPDNVRKFLKEYGYLKFDDNTRKEDLEFDPEKAIGSNLDKEYFSELLEEYDIDEKVYPIGEYCRGNLIVLMTNQSKFYCFTDGYLEKPGDDIDEMLDCLVGECREAEVIE